MNSTPIITEEELRLLQEYEGLKKDSRGYENLEKEALVLLCRLKDKNNDLFVRRYEAARAVIDLVARKVGFDPDNCGLSLYFPDEDEDGASSPITRRIEEWVDRHGEKAQLKKRIQELETENNVLRSLIKH